MAVPQSERLADILAPGTIVVTVPWAIVGGDDEGVPASGTATYTIAIPSPVPSQLLALCDDLDRLTANGIAVIS